MTWIEVDETKIQARLTAMPANVYGALVRKVTTLRLMLEAKIKGKLSDDVLHVRSGNLRRSIFSETLERATSVVGRAASSGDVKYAAIHEFGGVIKHPGGTPYIVTKDMAMGALFISKATAANFKTPPPVTRPHNIPMPERSFMRSSLADMENEIIAGLREAVGEGLAP